MLKSAFLLSTIQVMSDKPKVIVGLSGGVDSSVAAYLLQQQGYEVSGLFMKNWEADDDDEHCLAAQDLSDAQAVAQRLNIPLHTANFAKTYWDNVFQHFLAEYRAGRTPNPDILCNKEIKFKAFLEHAMALGADYIATGHYVMRSDTQTRTRLLKGKDNNKDQSYFLCGLTQAQLQKSLFPIGELQKSQVRELAAQLGFINHAKKDSTGICFIGERRFKDFLSEYLLAQPGPMQTAAGEVIGEHDGLMFYTLGQRQGLQIGGIKGYPEAPWYVLQKDIANNTLIVGQGQDHPLLYSQGLICVTPDWIAGVEPELPLACRIKTRYRQPDQDALVAKVDAQHYQVMFAKPQRAVTPGQSVVFYQGSECLGGAVITSTL